jgi:NADPH2:quinone reductase
LSFKGATYSGVFTLMPLLTGFCRRYHREILEAATALANAGKLMPIVDPRRFSLETVADAYRVLEAGDYHGKIVVDLGVGREQ